MSCARLPCRTSLAAALLIGVSYSTWSANEVRADYTAVDLFILSPPSFGGGATAGRRGVSAAGQVGGLSYSGINHAMLWTDNGLPLDLHPTHLTGSSTSDIEAADGVTQVGNYGSHAALWHGTPGSAVDLQPSGYLFSTAHDVAGEEQVGYAYTLTGNQPTHAMLWRGTAASAIDLNPTNLSGFDSSSAYGTDGAYQVGGASGAATNYTGHAMLWHGTPDSAVDLHPMGFDYSTAYGVGGGQQVGAGQRSGFGIQAGYHALLWSGTRDSVVDLGINLPQYDRSEAWATNGVAQVGWGESLANAPNPGEHALLWHGTAESVLDLDSLLPVSWHYSLAERIDAAGNVFGTAYDPQGRIHAVEWVVPEASSLWFIVGGVLLLGRRFRRS